MPKKKPRLYWEDYSQKEQAKFARLLTHHVKGSRFIGAITYKGKKYSGKDFFFRRKGKPYVVINGEKVDLLI